MLVDNRRPIHYNRIGAYNKKNQVNFVALLTIYQSSAALFVYIPIFDQAISWMFNCLLTDRENKTVLFSK